MVLMIQKIIMLHKLSIFNSKDILFEVWNTSYNIM
jgi:hypothetical protein